LVAEGVACYLLRLANPQSSMYDALWMMPSSSVDWCRENQETIYSRA
jgi:hypothetical protein